jgi:hypothetical protein
MKTCGGMASRISDLSTGERRMVNFTFHPLYLQEKSLWYPMIGGWVGSKAHLDAVGNRKVLPQSRIGYIPQPSIPYLTIPT